MKFVLLVDGSTSNFEKMIDLVYNQKSHFVDTTECDEDHEYRYLKDEISAFARSDDEVMLTKFSGRESIIRDLGDEQPEMIISMSYNKNSKWFTENPIKTFSDLLTVFRQGD